MANKKMTMVEKYTNTMAILRGEVVENFSVEDALAFLADRKEQTIKKNASNGERKPTPKEQEKTTEDNASKEVILEVLGSVEGVLTIGDMQKLNHDLAMLSNQKLTYLLTSLRKAGKVVRTEVKGKAHYSLTEV